VRYDELEIGASMRGTPTSTEREGPPVDSTFTLALLTGVTDVSERGAYGSRSTSTSRVSVSSFR